MPPVRDDAEEPAAKRRKVKEQKEAAKAAEAEAKAEAKARGPRHVYVECPDNVY